MLTNKRAICWLSFSPPLIRKKTHAFTARLKPKASEMYSRTLALGTLVKLASSVAAPAAEALATCVALKAKNRNRKVPINSPTIATKWLRGLLGKKPRKGILSSFLWPAFLRLPKPGMEMKLLEGWLMFILSDGGRALVDEPSLRADVGAEEGWPKSGDRVFEAVVQV